MHNRKFAISIIGVAAILAGCSSTGATAAPATAAPPASAPAASSAPSTAASTAPSAGSSGLTVSSFDSAFTAMSQLTSVTAAGTGLVGVLMPDTTSSQRWVDFDAPYLTQAFTAAGYKTTDFKIDNAQGVDATELSLAQADITAGAKVLVMAPIDSTVGGQIQTYAAAHGVALISYDRATFQGTNTYYVSFDNVQVGELIGKGFLQCLTDWAVPSPKVYTIDGGQDTDPNAIDFAKGYNDAVWGQKVAQATAGATSTTGGATLVGEQLAPAWNNATGGTIFAQAYTAHPEINATIEANDGLGGAVIKDLQAKGVPMKTIPTTGQDATLQGMEYVLQNFQCGSVYKPIYLEAQDAVVVATYLRAGQPVPASLMNSTTTDPNPKDPPTTEPASLLTPTWVTAANMESTVIKDQFIKAADLCAAVGAPVCTAAGIQ